MDDRKVYHCTYCLMTTHNKTDFSRHCKTKKHLKQIAHHGDFSADTPKCTQMHPNEPKNALDNTSQNKVKFGSENSIICPNCGITFTKASSLVRHVKKICIPVKEIKSQMKEMQNKMEQEKSELRNENEQLKDIIEIMNKQFFERIVYEKNRELDRMNQNIKLSLLGAIKSEYTDAPPLKAIRDIDEIPKLKHFRNTENGDVHFCESIREMKQKGQLARYIGDILVSIYKKDNPHDQSMWSTDISRLNYAVRKIVDKVPQWELDKKGLSVQKEVIKPLLKQIDKMLVKSSKYYQKYIERKYDRMTSIKYVSTLSEAMDDLGSTKLYKAILSYVSPYFINRSTKTIEYDDTPKPDKKSKSKKTKKPRKEQRKRKYKPSTEESEEPDTIESDEDEDMDIKTLRSTESITQSEHDRIIEESNKKYFEEMRKVPSRLFTTSGLDKKKR